MAYEFVREDAATFRFTGAGRSIKIDGVNATITSADTVLNGVYALLHIGGIEDRYIATEGERTVTEYVDSD